MGSQFQLVASGNFTSAGTVKDIALRSDFDFFETENHTQAATTQATGRGVMFQWRRGYADDSALEFVKTNATNALNMVVVTSGGFTRVDQSVQTLGAAKATSGTDVTNANPAVVTVTAHGYSNGSRIRIYGTTDMLQIAGMDFTIGNVSANSFELSYLDASGFASAATAGFVRLVPNNPIFFPNVLYITNITQAASAVVTLSVTHGMAVGGKVRFFVSSDNGMTQIDGLIGTITAVDTTLNTITVDINSTAFTAFTFPTSATAALGYTQAHIVPVGETATVLSQATNNTAQILMRLAAGAQSPAGSEGDAIYWRAWKAGYTNYEI